MSEEFIRQTIAFYYGIADEKVGPESIAICRAIEKQALKEAGDWCESLSDEYMRVYSKTQDSTSFAVAGGLLKGAESLRHKGELL